MNISGPKKAFTLIELLVVISIIALLLAIIMPSLNKAKEAARMVLCKTNLKQYYYGMETYLADNDQKYPRSNSAIFKATISPTPWQCQWHDRKTMPTVTPDNDGPLWSYLSIAKAHMCPTFQRIAVKYANVHPGHNPGIPIEPQYAYSQNGYLGWHIKKSGNIQKSTSDVALFVEETMWFLSSDPAMVGSNANIADWVLNDTNFLSRHPADGTYPGDGIGTYHGNVNIELKLSVNSGVATQTSQGGKGNVVFSDGHVDTEDPYDHIMVGGTRFNRSYLIAFPGKDPMQATKPY